ncbi:MAG: hypothetical protein AB7F22_07705 [Reyranella sp.]|uniref:hypothetical protein n=1 Tax=Reyranella sp. TaxID=1929291 RepID=UPI003D149C93
MTKWNEILKPENQTADIAGVVIEAVKDAIARRPGAPFGTMALIEVIYPEALAKGEGVAARQRLIKIVQQLGKSGALAGYCSRGEPRPGKAHMRNKMVRPWLWHAYIAPPEKDALDRAADAAGITRLQAQKFLQVWAETPATTESRASDPAPPPPAS